MNNKQPPSLLTRAGLNMYVDTLKLSKLPLPVQDISLEQLKWHFDMPVWSKDGTDDWNLTPHEVIYKKPGSKLHQKRVEDADTAFPILVINYKSKLVILDGIHRLVKVYLAGGKTIRAKIIPAIYLAKREFKT